MARGLKFCILVEEGLYYPSSENKGADQLSGVTAKLARLICAFVFAQALCCFSYAVAQFLLQNHDNTRTIY